MLEVDIVVIKRYRMLEVDIVVIKKGRYCSN